MKSHKLVAERKKHWKPYKYSSQDKYTSQDVYCKYQKRNILTEFKDVCKVTSSTPNKKLRSCDKKLFDMGKTELEGYLKEYSNIQNSYSFSYGSNASDYISTLINLIRIFGVPNQQEKLKLVQGYLKDSLWKLPEEIMYSIFKRYITHQLKAKSNLTDSDLLVGQIDAQYEFRLKLCYCEKLSNKNADGVYKEFLKENSQFLLLQIQKVVHGDEINTKLLSCKILLYLLKWDICSQASMHMPLNINITETQEFPLAFSNTTQLYCCPAYQDKCLLEQLFHFLTVKKGLREKNMYEKFMNENAQFLVSMVDTVMKKNDVPVQIKLCEVLLCIPYNEQHFNDVTSAINKLLRSYSKQPEITKKTCEWIVMIGHRFYIYMSHLTHINNNSAAEKIKHDFQEFLKFVDDLFSKPIHQRETLNWLITVIRNEKDRGFDWNHESCNNDDYCDHEFYDNECWYDQVYCDNEYCEKDYDEDYYDDDDELSNFDENYYDDGYNCDKDYNDHDNCDTNNFYGNYASEVTEYLITTPNKIRLKELWIDKLESKVKEIKFSNEIRKKGKAVPYENKKQCFEFVAELNSENFVGKLEEELLYKLFIYRCETETVRSSIIGILTCGCDTKALTKINVTLISELETNEIARRQAEYRHKTKSQMMIYITRHIAGITIKCAHGKDPDEKCDGLWDLPLTNWPKDITLFDPNNRGKYSKKSPGQKLIPDQELVDMLLTLPQVTIPKKYKDIVDALRTMRKSQKDKSINKQHKAELCSTFKRITSLEKLNYALNNLWESGIFTADVHNNLNKWWTTGAVDTTDDKNVSQVDIYDAGGKERPHILINISSESITLTVKPTCANSSQVRYDFPFKDELVPLKTMTTTVSQATIRKPSSDSHQKVTADNQTYSITIPPYEMTVLNSYFP
ncbi:Hypothetical predicted protein [Mytilus galloprovincialis]|uniref:Uncharacterized protein n=1 Tax=Mytilus galloprovincialis TaxID=29158 RepID=A0A8B6G026_MYTGA|nr:Hypothetical predicted protein [Mytilus galloprovincialis]